MNRREALKMGCGAALAAAGWRANAWAGQAAGGTSAALKMSESMKDMDKAVRLLFDEYVRDPSICLGPDGTYYLTGTTRARTASASGSRRT